jgi:hypothetical protein
MIIEKPFVSSSKVLREIAGVALKMKEKERTYVWKSCTETPVTQHSSILMYSGICLFIQSWFIWDEG